MANLRHSLKSAVEADGETIIAIVVGKHDLSRYDEPAKADENITLSALEGLAKIDEEYDAGYGGADCYPFWAWTESKVYFVAEYDGSTWLTWVPRNPQDGKPEFSGQS